MDHHQSWIITGSSSKLDHHRNWIITGSSSKLDHQWIIIIIIASAISINWFYLSILLVIGTSTELSLFHASCRPSLHVGIYLLWHLYLTTCQKGPPLTSDHGRNTSNIHVRKALPTLTSDHGRNKSNIHVIKA